MRQSVKTHQEALELHCEAVQRQMVDEKRLVEALASAVKGKRDAEAVRHSLKRPRGVGKRRRECVQTGSAAVQIGGRAAVHFEVSRQGGAALRDCSFI